MHTMGFKIERERKDNFCYKKKIFSVVFPNISQKYFFHSFSKYFPPPPKKIEITVLF